MNRADVVQPPLLCAGSNGMVEPCLLGLTMFIKSGPRLKINQNLIF